MCSLPGDFSVRQKTQRIHGYGYHDFGITRLVHALSDELPLATFGAL
jgi:hypothetical protein